MSRQSGAAALLAAGALSALAGCTDRLPTLTGEGPFPIGGVATTIEYFIDSDDLLLDADVYVGPTGVEDISGLLIANDFDGGLTSHALVTFSTFPDTIEVVGESDGDFTYLAGEVLGTIPDTLSASDPVLNLQLWTVSQPWDTAAVSWENAVNRPGEIVPWTTPGGTRGQLLGSTTWTRSAATAGADSLVWDISPSVINRLAADELQGLMVTLAEADSRVVISNLVLRTEIQPSVDPDTTVTRTIGVGPQTFVFTPDPPRPADVLRVGGVTSDRSILELALPEELPGCAPPGVCAPIRADEVTLDRVELLLDPVPVQVGYRPVQPLPITVREVLDPDLGERAPLGSVITGDTVTAARFTEAGDRPVRFRFTNTFLQALESQEDPVLSVALLVEPEAASFAYAWFEPVARLRILYTLPQTPQLP
jgi:hypothetical protein